MQDRIIEQKKKFFEVKAIERKKRSLAFQNGDRKSSFNSVDFNNEGNHFSPESNEGIYLKEKGNSSRIAGDKNGFNHRYLYQKMEKVYHETIENEEKSK